MKNLIIIFLALVFLFFYIPAKAQTISSSGEQYDLVQSKKLPEEIHSWLFSKDKILAMSDERIMLFLDSGMESLKLPDGYLKSITSRNGNFFGVVSLSAKQESRDKTLKLTVYNQDFEIIYNIEKNQFYDEPYLAIYILDRDGSAIIGRPTTSDIWFYNNSGNLIAEHTLFPDSEYDLERKLDIESNSGSSLIAIAATNHGMKNSIKMERRITSNPHLFTFSLKGVQQLKKPINDSDFSNLVISEEGHFFAIGSYTIDQNQNIVKRTNIFDEQGDAIAHTNLLLRHAAFSPSSDYLIVAEKQSAVLIDLSNGKKVWRYNVPKEQGIVVSLNLGEAANRSAILIAKNQYKDHGFVYNQPQIQIIDKTGFVTQKLIIENQEFKKPALKFLKDAQQILIGFEQEYQIYRTK